MQLRVLELILLDGTQALLLRAVVDRIGELVPESHYGLGPRLDAPRAMLCKDQVATHADDLPAQEAGTNDLRNPLLDINLSTFVSHEGFRSLL